MSAPEETWADVEEYGIRVSSLGVVVSASTGRILTAYRRKCGTTVYSIGARGGLRRTASIDWIMERAGHWRMEDRVNPDYSPAEDSIIRLARSCEDAMRRLPRRSRESIKARKRHVAGAKWERGGRGGPRVTSPKVWGRDMYDRIRAACPKGIPHDVREDLVQDVAVMVLEGFTGALQDAYRQAVRTRNRVFGTYAEVSGYRPAGYRHATMDTFTAGASL